MTCKECGSTLQPGALLCDHCGAPVPQQEPAPSRQPAPRRPRRRKKKNRGIKWLVLAVLVLGVAAGFLIWKFGGAQEAPQPDPAQTESDTPQETVHYEASLTPYRVTLEEGDSMTLTGKVTPEDVAVKGITWRTSDPAVATVSGGILHAIKAGSCTVTAQFAMEDGAVTTASAQVIVEAPKIAYKVIITPDTVELAAGASVELVATLEPELPEGVTVTATDWSSSNTGAATVVNGHVTGGSEGSATVTATLHLSDGQILTASVPVRIYVPAPQPSAAETGTANQGGQAGGQTSAGGQPGGQTTGGQAGGTGSQPAEPVYILKESNTAYVSYETLRALSDWELCLARNELYARHGRKFQDPDLRRYFESQSWYKGTIEPADFDEDVFNEYEQENLKRILEVERSRHPA